jgi:hypothetical protein
MDQHLEEERSGSRQESMASNHKERKNVRTLISEAKSKIKNKIEEKKAEKKHKRMEKALVQELN